ncbi:hypothetical protein FKP32DRAFT_428824 [Trametes sanguinea]|nr:hypothetical protein FKP32DRAFT_428824 [Trametes sanguinea]
MLAPPARILRQVSPYGMDALPRAASAQLRPWSSLDALCRARILAVELALPPRLVGLVVALRSSSRLAGTTVSAHAGIRRDGDSVSPSCISTVPRIQREPKCRSLQCLDGHAFTYAPSVLRGDSLRPSSRSLNDFCLTLVSTSQNEGSAAGLRDVVPEADPVVGAFRLARMSGNGAPSRDEIVYGRPDESPLRLTKEPRREGWPSLRI